MLSFTYFQVMPQFLDFLFLFGKQTYAEDLYCSGFRQRTRLRSSDKGLSVPELGWSGRDLQVCYSLKSVERSDSQGDWPWSIRHCATHHSFDAENVRSTWIVIKGDQLIERRIQSATSDRGPLELSSFQTIDKAFAAALATHLILCDWSAENWRWYIKFLEERFQETTRGTISTNADLPLSPVIDADNFAIWPRIQAQRTNQSQTGTSSFPFFSRTQTWTTENSRMISEKQQPPSWQIYTNPDTGLKQPLPPGSTIDTPQISKPKAHQNENYGQQQFSFSDLQKIQDIDEKAVETALVLKLNINVVSQLRQYYRSIFESQELSEKVGQQCKGELLRFERRIDGIESDLQLQILRVEGLLHLLADRKTLVSYYLPTYTATYQEMGRWHHITANES